MLIGAGKIRHEEKRMLLRRISEHLSQQNWTAVAIDFLIVVLGVFMGIQVQAWYESQREQQLVTNYLHRLNEDFSLSISGSERTRVFVNTNLDNLGIVLSSLRDCSVADEHRDRFANGLFHMGKLIPAQFVDGTLEELRASGRLLLVDNDELRNAINETVREHDYQARVWPALQARAASSRSYISDNFIFWLSRPVNGFSNVSWNELEFDLMQACKDKVLLAKLSDLHRLSSVSIDWLDRNLNNFLRVKTFLDMELDNQRRDR
jgi:hypothetical protein